jgi:hypothetical protein
VSESLTVELNADGLHTIAAAPSFTTDGPFDVVLDNAGEAVHVHLHLDDSLSTVSRLDGGNHYVEGGATTRVGVRVSPRQEPVTGKLKVVTGYGAETAYVDVTVEPSPDEKPGIEVDEDLGRPPQNEPEPSLVDEFGDAVPTPTRAALPVVGLVGVAVIVAALVVATVESTALVLGVGVVLGAAVAAALFLMQS